VPDRLPKGTLNGRRAGEVAHRIIGEFVQSGIYLPTPAQIAAVVANHPETKRAVVYRQAARQRLATAVSLYFRLFGPDPTWELLGVEVSASRSRFDLVWELLRGRVIADELKTGLFITPDEATALHAQVERLRSAGVRKYGEQFAGVRVLLLSAPRLSYLAAPTGENIPLEDAGL